MSANDDAIASGARPAGASPDEIAVEKIAAPGGGYWYVTNLGGVWTEGGAPMLGNYFGIDPIHQNNPDRVFTGIRATPEGGYTLIANDAPAGYTFNPAGTPGGPPAATRPPSTISTFTPFDPAGVAAANPAPQAPPPQVTSPNTTPPTTTIPGPGSNPSNPEGARAILRMYLDSWGLSSLADQLWGSITGDETAEQIVLQIRDTDAWKSRFQAVVARQANGLPAISEAEVIAFETQARQTMRAYGLPPGFYDDPSDFVNFMANDVSVAEIAQRVQIAANLAYSEPSDVLAEANRLYGIDPGALAAYVLDPDRALPLIQKQVRAAEAAGAAMRTGFGSLSLGEAERVGSLVSSPEQAQQGFTRIAAMGELRGGIIGEAGDTAQMSTGELIDATFAGDVNQQERISRRQRGRLSRFQESGQYIGSATAGAIGTGTAK